MDGELLKVPFVSRRLLGSSPTEAVPPAAKKPEFIQSLSSTTPPTMSLRGG